MWKRGFLFLCCVYAGAAEVHTLTLKEAVDMALRQSPDVLLARLDESRAEQAVRLETAPFVPKLVVGSGLAYSSGFPLSIEGASPSIFQANAIGNVFNRPQMLKIGVAKENRRGGRSTRRCGGMTPFIASRRPSSMPSRRPRWRRWRGMRSIRSPACWIPSMLGSPKDGTPDRRQAGGTQPGPGPLPFPGFRRECSRAPEFPGGAAGF